MQFDSQRARTSAFYLPYLLAVLIPLIMGGAEPREMAITTAVATLYAAVNVLAHGWAGSFPSLPATARVACWLVPQLVIFGLLAWIAGPACFGVIPFIAVFLAAFLPLSWALVGVALILASTTPLLLQLDEAAVWIWFAGIAIVSFWLVALISHRRNEDDKRALAAELAIAREREDIYRDVHDLLGQSLTVITLQANVARTHADDEVRGQLDEIIEISRASLAEVRRAAHQAHLPSLETEIARARQALKAAGIGVTANISPGVESALFAWVLREAVTNVVRHSEARHCAIEISAHHLRVEDDGRGIPAGEQLTTISHRVTAAGATLRVGSLKEPAQHNYSGTTIEVFAR